MFLAIQTIAEIHGIFTDENELTTFYSVKLIDNDGLSNENKNHVLCSHSTLDSPTPPYLHGNITNTRQPP